MGNTELQAARTNPESGRCIGFHDFADVTGKLSERGANMSMLYNEGSGDVGGSGQLLRPCSLQVGSILPSARHLTQVRER
jgi:hypothetical protein